MEKSPTILELAKALNTFQAKAKIVKKDGDNPFFKSKYATLEHIIETNKALLGECGLALSQFPHGENELTSILMHNSGEWIQDTVKMTPKDGTPQALGSAITYMRRYSRTAILGIATDEADDDANVATGRKKGAAAETPKTDFAKKANDMIAASNTVDGLMIIGEQVEKSINFTEAQKIQLRKKISTKIEALENTAP